MSQMNIRPLNRSQLKTKSKTALVTGATGYIGSNLTKRLLSNGWDVHIITRSHSSTALLQDVLQQISIHLHDGSTESVFTIMERVKPTIVFHLASLFLAEHQPKDLIPLIQSNILFATQLIEAMVSYKVYHLINTGTSWQHFQNKAYSPVCLYAATKQAFETIVTFYTQTTPLQVIHLKLFDSYGPNDPRPKLFYLLRQAAQENKTLSMSPGEQQLDLVYIDDIVAAYLLAAKRLEDGYVQEAEEYAISSGNTLKLKDVVQQYELITGKRLSIHWGERPYRPREMMIPWNTGANLPGWQPKITLEEGIFKMEWQHK